VILCAILLVVGVDAHAIEGVVHGDYYLRLNCLDPSEAVGSFTPMMISLDDITLQLITILEYELPLLDQIQVT
jgi:hypothetical protein